MLTSCSADLAHKQTCIRSNKVTLTHWLTLTSIFNQTNLSYEAGKKQQQQIATDEASPVKLAAYNSKVSTTRRHFLLTTGQTLKDTSAGQQATLTRSFGGLSAVLPNSPISTTSLNVKLTYLTKTSWLAQLVQPALPVVAYSSRSAPAASQHEGVEGPCDRTQGDKETSRVGKVTLEM